MRNFLLGLLVLSAPLFITGCGCTEVGCASGVDFTVEGALTVYQSSLPITLRACAASTCGDFTIKPGANGPVCESTAVRDCTIDAQGNVSVFIDALLEGTVPATVEVKDQDGVVLFTDSADVDLEAQMMNGPQCGVTCRFGSATFTPGVSSSSS